MDEKKLRTFIELAKEAGVSELYYESDDEKIKVKLPYSNQPMMPMAMPAQAPGVQIADTGQDSKSSADTNLIEITSPFVGTFYRSASPESAPYIKEGDRISGGKVLCIVEAMKIMNEIESEVSGEIVEICVENETYVEFGQVLFRVRP